MEFCNLCGSIMFPTKMGRKSFWVCKECGHKRINKTRSIKFKNEAKHEKIPVIEKEEVNLPIISKFCPKCGRGSAYYWMQQTKITDEPPTQFFRCTKCSYTWREY
ncbi:MAG: transcription factor S [Candidatus Aenigmatarchaeota archaeon]